jgi:predicted metalloprotease with PDZ domain
MGIGVRVVQVDGEDAEVSITYVWPDSPAAEAGLVQGDLVVAVNGVRISPEQFRSMTRRLLPGDPISLTLENNGQARDVTLVAGTVPPREVMVRTRLQEELEAVRSRMSQILTAEELALVDQASGEVVGAVPTIIVEGERGDSIRGLVLRGLARDTTEARIRIAFGEAGGGAYVYAPRLPRGEAEALAAARASVVDLAEVEELARPLAPFIAGANRVSGAEVRALNAGLSAYFQVDEGILVTSVAPGTPAADAGLRPGDVIQRVDGRTVGSVERLREALSNPRVKDHALQVIRRGESLTLSIR